MSPATPRTVPTLELETELARAGHRFVAGMDEVGRGALAGPASVGLAVMDLARWSGVPFSDSGSLGDGSSGDAARVGSLTGRGCHGDEPTSGPPPWSGVRDSKALSPARRAALAPTIASWAADTAVGHVQPREIDELGITAALRVAGLRALAAVAANGTRVDALILDGSHNWLDAPPVLGQEADDAALPPVVRTLVRADAQCVSVAAASILAKVERDDLMVSLGREFPVYGWESNKGYGSAVHRAALLERGTTPQHRLSWNLGTR